VTFVELFFDLVFVFAVTQLSHGLLEHFSLRGGLETGMLLLAVWWVWMYTAWFTNWTDPERIPVRLVMFAMMLTGLILAAAIPGAFGDRGGMFGLAYAIMQVGRNAFMIWAVRRREVMRGNFIRIQSWQTLSAVLWGVGGFAAPDARIAWWGVALAIEYAGPAARYWLPRMGPSSVASWNISGEHMAERCGLFIIIALGESILVTGTTFANLPWSSVSLTAFITAFVGTAAMWWLYFNATAGMSTNVIAKSEDPGRLGRLAYTYIHLVIVAGIVLTAVGDEMFVAHPGGRSNAATWITVAGGPLLYLFGILLFKWAVFRVISRPKSLGIAALLALWPVHPALSPLALAMAATLVLVAVGAWETVELRRLERSGGVHS